MDNPNVEVKIGTVHLNVTHLERAAFFFTEALGMAQVPADSQSITLAVESSQPLVTLHQVNNPPPQKATTGLYHLALVLPQREDLARLILHLVNNNVEIQGVADHDVSESIYLSGPDDIGIEVYCDRPAQDWPLDPQGQIEMGTEELDLDNLLMTIKGKSKQWTGLPTTARIGHIHLRVAELEQTERFYSLLGFKLTQKYGDNALFLSSNDYHHQLGVNTWETSAADPLPADSAGLKSFELWVDSPLLSAIKERLTNAEISYTQDGQSIQVKDPNGINIELKEK